MGNSTDDSQPTARVAAAFSVPLFARQWHLDVINFGNLRDDKTGCNRIIDGSVGVAVVR